jgi:hypothetical protein
MTAEDDNKISEFSLNLTRLKKLTEKQKLSLAKNDIDGFIENLREKDEILSKTESLENIEITDRRIATKLRQELENLLEMEKENESMLASLIKETKNKLKEINGKKKAASAYYHQDIHLPHFLDKSK